MNLITENPFASVTALAGAIVAIVVYVLGLFGIDVPIEVSGAIGVIIIFLLGRYTRISKEDAELIEHKDQLT
jgi:hypothetical protein